MLGSQTKHNLDLVDQSHCCGDSGEMTTSAAGQDNHHQEEGFNPLGSGALLVGEINVTFVALRCDASHSHLTRRM